MTKTLRNSPFPLVDPMRFLVDEEVRPFVRDARQDLTATGALAAPQLSTGVFIVNQFTVEKNQVDVVMGVAPHLWARVDPGDPNTETLAPLPDEIASMGAGQGWWLFNTLRAGQQPYVVQTNYNKPRVQASANNNDRFIENGLTWLPQSVTSFMQFGFNNALTPIVCQPDTLFQVTFQLAPTAAASAASPNPYQIGAGSNRIDCAGAVVFGLSIPKPLYDSFVLARRDGLLGAEAG